ncbi:MAG: MBL fold metallo-hydrolase [Oscillospiraceae bacterium]|nr:MBL fold metallo-hydrolase [Oscillospiraceae bacterium]
MAKLLYQGHGSFRITAEKGTVIYVDPFAGEGYDAPADWALVSHEHHDHNKLELLTMKEQTRVLRAADLLKDGVYGGVEADGIKVQAVPAYNKNHDRNTCVGFIVTVDGVSVYCAGDTSKTDYMAEMVALKLDYALLPMDGKYNMNVAEAMECAALIGAKHNIPIHMAPGALFDEAVAASFQAEGQLIVRPGEEIEL